MEKIYSKINGELLHMVHRLEDMVKSRIDVISDDNFLQLAVMKMEEGKTFRPHRHIYKEVSYDKVIAQESWVVIRGKVKVFMYDIKGSEILEDNTIAYEYKTGPYEGQALDKEFIN